MELGNRSIVRSGLKLGALLALVCFNNASRGLHYSRGCMTKLSRITLAFGGQWSLRFIAFRASIRRVSDKAVRCNGQGHKPPFLS